MSKNYHYRTGAVGALMDEYERALSELKTVINPVKQANFLKTLDNETLDPDCRSIQTIICHIINSGYGYANLIRDKFKTRKIESIRLLKINSAEESMEKLDAMFNYTLESVKDKWDIELAEIIENKMEAAWGQVYDFEQIIEHAIVHILRHRRQIEKFINLASGDSDWSSRSIGN